jgi:hypothetical protein
MQGEIFIEMDSKPKDTEQEKMAGIIRDLITHISPKRDI